jgi:hypothetical protein
MSDVQVATKLVAKVLALKDLDEYIKRDAELLNASLLLMPMKKVLDLVPGTNVTDRCERIGISRNTYYAWYRGEIRPNKHQAKRLQQLTGYPAEKFQGRR